MRTANVPVSLKDDGEPISRKQDVVMADQAPYDGLLGWECIRKYVWNINYPKRSHRFFNKLPSRIKSWNKLSLIPGSDYPQIADRHGRRIILDTEPPTPSTSPKNAGMPLSRPTRMRSSASIPATAPPQAAFTPTNACM